MSIGNEDPFIAFVWRPEDRISAVLDISHRVGCRAILDLTLAGFESGMIATILDVKLESITKYRYRLRLKFQLQNSDNLVDYLRQF